MGIPTEIVSLTNLKRLTLRGDLNGTIPENIGNLIHLTHFQVDYNALSGSLPSSIGSWRNSMEVLQVQNNDLSGTIPTEIGLLQNISTIDLSYNYFTGYLPTTLGLLTNSLHHLYISGNVNITG